ncbi:MAG: polysaccharide deacetylase family protein, partial [Candidatus Eremiobacteraeota bacterium]|nr:polysaccharide deacetylase family protein [Candidatus Eremiobacteraeota bacterium]
MSFSPRAIAYALRELARRAGISSDIIERSHATVGPKTVTLFLDLPAAARVVFAFDASKAQRFSSLARQPAATYEWIARPAAASEVPTFVVPFSDHAGGEPLFDVGDGVVECRADIITPTLWVLSRRGEMDSGERDAHGRFPATASIAYREGYLERPIVDEYGLALSDAIARAVPRWRRVPISPRVKLSHDIDLVGLPARVRTSLGHLYPRRNFGAFLADVRATIGPGRPAYLEAVFTLIASAAQRGLDSAFYWMTATRRTKHDSAYDVRNPKVRTAIEQLRDAGVEIGIHPSYHTLGSQSRLEDEVERLRSIAGSGLMGGRQHYLRWDPASWQAWERAGLAYDSSVGFADRIGFRAGTAVPYHPWLLNEDRESRLLEIPLIVMDSTPVAYMHLPEEELL